jgi:hypothetical protein
VITLNILDRILRHSSAVRRLLSRKVLLPTMTLVSLSLLGGASCNHPTQVIQGSSSWLTANAGWDCDSFVGSYVELNGKSRSSSDIDSVWYDWIEVEGNPEIFNFFPADPQQTIGFRFQGTYRFVLRAHARTFIGDPDTIVIRVGAQHSHTFKDPRLEMLIRWYLNMPLGDPTDADYAQIDTLVAQWFAQPLTSLEGIDKCINLRFIQFSIQRIADLAPLRNLSRLEFLWVDQNFSIVDLSPLSGLTNLRSLNIDENLVVDLAPLAGLNHIKEFIASWNPLTDISTISQMSELQYLDLSFIPISDLGPVRNLVKLRQLRLWGCSLNDISSCSTLVDLVYLNLWDNQITDVSNLSPCTNLVRLYLNGNRVTEIGALKGLTSLAILGLSNNHITNIRPLVENTGIAAGDAVSLGGNPLDSISVQGYVPALKTRGVNVFWP